MRNFIQATKDELNKVLFPNKKEVINNFKMVLGFTLILTIFLAILDLGINNILRILFN